MASGFKPTQHWIWSHGCNSQFKSRVPWYFVNWHSHIIGGCRCVWNFFGSGHGKGMHDGVGVVLKHFNGKAQLDVQGPELKNVE